MNDALTNAFSVLLIICLAYFFKRIKLLNIDVARSLASVVMYITLPCAILTSANGIDFDVSLLGVMLISALANFILLTIAFFSSRDPKQRVFNMINVTCFNIGNFIVPFMQSTMSPKAFLALCMFDVVNALFCFGGSYSIALYFNRKYFPENQINLKSIFKEMSKSLPFYVYVLVITLSACSITIPEGLLTPFKTIAGANTLLCFMIIGIALNFNITKEQLKFIFQAWALRYIVCAVLAALVWIFVPLEPEIRIIVMIILMAPMSSIAPIMTMKALPKNAEESADLNTVAIISSLVFVTIMNSITSMLG